MDCCDSDLGSLGLVGTCSGGDGGAGVVMMVVVLLLMAREQVQVLCHRDSLPDPQYIKYSMVNYWWVGESRYLWLAILPGS